MKLTPASLAIGAAIGAVATSIIVFISLNIDNSEQQDAIVFFVGGSVYEITTDILVIDQSFNGTASADTQFLNIKLGRGSAFFSEGVQLSPSEIPAKVTKGINLCAHVILSDGNPDAGKILNAGKIFLDTTCAPYLNSVPSA